MSTNAAKIDFSNFSNLKEITSQRVLIPHKKGTSNQIRTFTPEKRV